MTALRFNSDEGEKANYAFISGDRFKEAKQCHNTMKRSAFVYRY
jgi:hypothetical protein